MHSNFCHFEIYVRETAYEIKVNFNLWFQRFWSLLAGHGSWTVVRQRMIVAGWCKWLVMFTCDTGKQRAVRRGKVCLSRSLVRANCHRQLDCVVNPLGDNASYDW